MLRWIRMGAAVGVRKRLFRRQLAATRDSMVKRVSGGPLEATHPEATEAD
jgi:hypothetical protein